MNRITFLKRAISTVVATGAGILALESCSKSDDAVAALPSCIDNGAKPLSISANHGHTLTIPKADVASGVSKSYNIIGSATHAHEVTLSPDDFAKLKNNEQIGIVSTNNVGHEHTIVVRCA